MFLGTDRELYCFTHIGGKHGLPDQRRHEWLPVVQIIRFGDAIPFDVNQMRTVTIDNRDIYSLLPNVELYKSEIASQARRALGAGVEVDTAVSMYFTNGRFSL